MKIKPPEKDTGFSDLFRGVNYQGYGFWSFPKNKPYTPFLIGLMYILWFPIGAGILVLSFAPAFWLRDFLYDKGFFDDKGFGSIVFSMVAFYLPIYIFYKVIDYNKKEALRKKAKKEHKILQETKDKKENNIKFIREKYKITYSQKRFEYILENIDYANEDKMKEFLMKQSYRSIYKPRYGLDKQGLKKTSTKNVKPIETKNEKNKLSREEIIRRLKEFKDLYDSGILSKEEYEQESSKLKDLLIGN